MRILRQVANSILRSGLSLLKDAPPAAKERAVRSIVRILAPLDFPLIQERTPEALLGAVRIMAEAVATTPYGEPLRYPTPLVITVGSTTSCPFPCANCYSNSTDASSHSAQHAGPRLFQRIAASAAPFVMIGGGEPLATPNIGGLVQLLLDAGKVVYFATNASLTPLIDQIARHKGQLVPFLSVWGAREEHDRQRGRGSYDRLARNLENLNGVDARGNLLVVLSSSDLSIFDTVADLVSKTSVRTVLVTRKLFAGRTAGGPFNPSPQVLRNILERIRSIQPHVVQVSVDIPELSALKLRRPPLLQRLLGIPAATECGAGNWTMHLDSAGQGYPCFSLETSQELGIGADLEIADQWKKVVRLRRTLGSSSPCLGERAIVSEA